MAKARVMRMNAINAIKRDRGCMSCKERHPACLDFHHRDPMQKTLSVGVLICRCAAMDTILEEIEKCDVLCSNCHRKLHWQQKRPRRPKKQKETPQPVEALRLA
jgi:hypothetical protein